MRVGGVGTAGRTGIPIIALWVQYKGQAVDRGIVKESPRQLVRWAGKGKDGKGGKMEAKKVKYKRAKKAASICRIADTTPEVQYKGNLITEQ